MIQRHQPTSLAIAIFNNDHKEVERLLMEKNTLDEKDFSSVFAIPENITTEVLDLLDKYRALPENVSIETLKYVLYLHGNKNIDLNQIEGKTINLTGCPGLDSPMRISTHNTDISTVTWLMECGVQERPLFNLSNPLSETVFRPTLLTSLQHFKDTISNNFTSKRLSKQFRIAELFLSNPTAELKKEFDNEEKKPVAKFRLLPFLSWLSANNRIDIFENEYFQRLIKMYPDTFSTALFSGAVFKSNKFIEKSIPTLVENKQINELHKLINISAIECNHELLVIIIKKIEEMPEGKFVMNAILGNHKNGQNPLFWAIRYNNIESTDYLIKKGVDINVLMTAGETYLDLAIRTAIKERNVGILNAFKENINKKDSQDDTSLMRAAHCGKLNIIETLLECKYIDVYCKNKNGETARDIAVKNGQEKIVRILDNFLLKEQQNLLVFGLFGAGQSSLKTLSSDCLFDRNTVKFVSDFLRPK
jgi:ankyrin repeat protein